MGTSKSAVMAYVDSAVYQQLVEFKDRQKLRSLSCAVEIILGEYFEASISNTNLISYRLLRQQELLTKSIFRLADNYDKFHQGLIAKDPSNSITASNTHPEDLSGESKNLFAHDNNHFSSTSDGPLGTRIAPEIIKRGLKGIALANRLKICSSSLSRKRSKPDFRQWTQQLDPDGIAWEYQAMTRNFYPVKSI